MLIAIKGPGGASSCPRSFSPQQTASPASVSAQAPCPPTLIAVNGPGCGSGSGTGVPPGVAAGAVGVGAVGVGAGTGVAVAVTAGGAGGGVDAAAGGGGRVGAGVAAAIRSAVVVAAPGVTDGGASPPLVQARQETLDAAYSVWPERFRNGPPRATRPPKEAWINKPVIATTP